MAIFQIVNGKCHWQTPFTSLDEVKDRFPPDCLFVDAPDYVNEQWGFDETEIGDDRFIKPVPPEGWIYDDETGQLMPEEMQAQALEQAKENKQNENNAEFAKWLEEHPLTWTDGKQYGVTMQDQQEIALNILSYQMANEMASQASAQAEGDPATTGTITDLPGFVLEWHAINEACVPWTIENMTLLSVAIRSHIYPGYTLNQNYKTQIFACETRGDVEKITFDYSTIYPADETPTDQTESADQSDPSADAGTETPAEPADDATEEATPEVTTPEETSPEA